jgi:hypothetical protein
MEARMTRTMAPLVLMAIPLLACPYEAPHPIAAASQKPIDPRLAGDWRCVGTGGNELLVLKIASLEPATFVLTVPGEPNTPPMRFHSATLAGKPVLNVENADPPHEGRQKWALARYTLHRPNLVEFEVAREEPFKEVPAGAGLADVAARALRRGELFDQFCACVRAEPSR